MNGLKSREEYERNMFLLKEQNIKFASHLKRNINSLGRVRYLPNKRIDLLSIDEKARCLANTVMMTLDNDILKNINKKDDSE